MGRKIRVAKAQIAAAPLTPALRAWLVTGWPLPSHLCGAFSPSVWNCDHDPLLAPCLMNVPGGMALLFMSEDEIRAAWEAYQFELVADAARYRFRPAAAAWFSGEWKYGRAHPLDVTSDWRRQFMKMHAGR
jgi:hypothetical protein